MFREEAPKAVENFIQLAQKEYYNGVLFHRVIDNFMIQGGDPTGTGSGGESIYGKYFEDETNLQRKFDRPGLLAMANAGPNTNGSQFFITLVPAPWLNNHYTIFGEVVSGMDVVKAIGKVRTTKPEDKPVKDIVMRRVYLKGRKNEPTVSIAPGPKEPPEPVVKEKPVKQPAQTERDFSVRIVSNTAISTQAQLMLQFLFRSTAMVEGKRIESYLKDGVLELVEPNGTKRSVKNFPQSPTHAELARELWLPEALTVTKDESETSTSPLGAMDFLNGTDNPIGPQLRIPLPRILDITLKGVYEVSWHSRSLISNAVKVEWDGSSLKLR